ncbi:MAG: CBS domain-containing protein [Thermoplasmata archaeon]|nr:CBS domain-containing protein [Thermoplasmata archaeon]
MMKMNSFEKKLLKYKQYDSLLINGRISDFMSKPPITLTGEATMADAKALMRDNKISGIPIVDDGDKLTGLVSLENIIVALENQKINDPIHKHMVTNVSHLMDDMAVSAVMSYLMTHGYHRYPVVNKEKKVVGIVTRGDLMLHLYTQLGNIYMHNKRRDDLLTPVIHLSDSDKSMDDMSFSYDINTRDIDMAGKGSTLFKKFLQEHEVPVAETRRASISLYEAEVNVVIHGGGKGEIKGYLVNNQIFMVVVDHGPGIEDIDLAMEIGYTTATAEARKRGFGAGLGLNNIKQYSDKLIIISSSDGVKIEMVVIPENK